MKSTLVCSCCGHRALPVLAALALWVSAAPGENVGVSLAGQTQKAETAADEVTVAPLKGGDQGATIFKATTCFFDKEGPPSVPVRTEIGAAGKLKVLLITGGHGFEKEPFLKVFKETPGIDFTHVEHAKESATAYERGDILDQNVVVLYDMPKTLTADQKAKFLALFERGIGLVVMHHALASYQNWPDYERIIGGRYPEVADAMGPAGGYEHDVDVPVVIVAKDHPITAGVRDFMIHDEIYWNFRTAADVTPLITTTNPKSGKPLAWTRTEGRSRIVYLQLGHDHSAYENPNFRRLLAQAIRWTAGR